MGIEQIHTIDELVKDSYETATDKGWHDPDHPRTVGELIALMHSELSEALEDHRSGHGLTEVYYETKHEMLNEFSTDSLVVTEFSQHDLEVIEKQGAVVKNPKPCGIPIELADCIIRIADFCGENGINLMSALNLKADYNRTRSHRHGGKVI